MTASPFQVAAGGVRVAVRVTPKASADRVRGVALDQAGVAWLQVSVTAVPEDGRANKAVTALLARRWRVPKTAVEVVQGATDRRKTLLIRDDDPAGLATRLDDWLRDIERKSGEAGG
ncbi:DUF167 family protein [Thalassobaculum sp.]|uniref:DUF167 domain-containing protein n=1 Tax=Thalassobaculum sp. TaxID=2022740 RepID=UPI0032EB09DF